MGTFNSSLTGETHRLGNLPLAMIPSGCASHCPSDRSHSHGVSSGSDERLAAHRDAYCAAIRAHHADGKMARRWSLRFLIRHTAFHTLDHAWEMEDKDLTARQA